MEPVCNLPTLPLHHVGTLSRLWGRINYERDVLPAGFSDTFKLDRMRELLALLGNPERKLRIVHVAGTKGKGSTSTMIASALSASGLRTGLFTSPHLDRVEERLAVDGVICSSERFLDLVEQVWPAVESMDRAAARGSSPLSGPTFFEIVTALAAVYFAESQVDAAVLEVGMGGRLDSTNACPSRVSVITSISFDHTQQLGNTLAAIAREKAGILKPGVPLICGVCQEEPREVITNVAEERVCPVRQMGHDFDFHYHLPLGEAEPGTIDFDCRFAPDKNLRNVAINLVGRHQGANAAVALAVLAELTSQGWDLPESAIRSGLARATLPARIEVIGTRPTVILDAAHNVASVEALLEVLTGQFPARRRLLVFATTQDKDVRGMLARLLPRFDEVIFTRYQNNPRAVSPAELEALAQELGSPPHRVLDDPAQAWEYARRWAKADDLVCIAGSFFLAGEIRSLIVPTLQTAGS